MPLPRLLVAVALHVAVARATLSGGSTGTGADRSLLADVLDDRPFVLWDFGRGVNGTAVTSVAFPPPQRSVLGGGDQRFPSFSGVLQLHSSGSAADADAVMDWEQAAVDIDASFAGLTPAAVLFDGVSRYGEVTFPDARALNPAHSFTLEAWVRFRGGTAGDHTVFASPAYLVHALFTCAGPCGARGYAVSFDQHHQAVTFETGSGAAATCAVTSGRTPLQSWTHIVAVHDAAAGRNTLYVRDRTSGSRRAAAAVSAPCAPLVSNSVTPFRVGAGAAPVVDNLAAVVGHLHVEVAAVALYKFPLPLDRLDRLGVFDGRVPGM